MIRKRCVFLHKHRNNYTVMEIFLKAFNKYKPYPRWWCKTCGLEVCSSRNQSLNISGCLFVVVVMASVIHKLLLSIQIDISRATVSIILQQFLRWYSYLLLFELGVASSTLQHFLNQLRSMISHIIYRTCLSDKPYFFMVGSEAGCK